MITTLFIIWLVPVVLFLGLNGCYLTSLKEVVYVVIWPIFSIFVAVWCMVKVCKWLFALFIHITLEVYLDLRKYFKSLLS